MKMLLASDLDGTLLKENKLLQCNKVAVKRLVDNGHKFIVATGRPYNGVEFLINDHDMNIDYYVLLNGALILDKNRNKIVHKVINFSTVEEIITKYVDKNTKLALENGYSTFLLYETNEECAYSGKVLIDDIEKIRNEEIALISMYFPENSIEEINSICIKISNEYSNEVIAYRNSNFIDVVPLGCSKGEGVKLVSDIEKMDMDKVYTIGDSWNDESMFNITRNSFTFSNAEEALKGKTNFVVDSVEECINNYMF